MERKDKVAERDAEKQELMVKKLKRGILVGKRAGPSTPSPTWRLEFSSQNAAQDNNANHSNEFLSVPAASVSARKLCAHLWELQTHYSLVNTRKGASKLRQQHQLHQKGKGFDADVGPPNSRPNQPTCGSSLRKHFAAPAMQQHRSAERNGHALHPASNASCGSSMEVAPYKPAVSPSTSLDAKGRRGESSYSLKTSKELIKILNRIRALEEQHVSNMTLVKAQKKELDHSRARIKELLQEKKKDRQELDGLVKQAVEDKIERKNKEQERIKSVIHSVRDELEDERKLRTRSESLHHKLARELSDVKFSFSNALKELEREREARILLENLCDEFAKGIRDYEREVRSLRHKHGIDHIDGENPERLILHISEAWLDERMQTKLAEGQNDPLEKDTIVDKLSLDIETFLQAKRRTGSRENVKLTTDEQRENYSWRQSLESFPLNEAVSAPQAAVDEEDSSDGGSRHYELNKNANRLQSKGSSKHHGDDALESYPEELVNQSSSKKKGGPADISRGVKFHSLQGQLDEQKARGKINKDNEDTVEGLSDRRIVKHGKDHRSNSSNVLDNLIRNHSLSSEGDKVHPESILREDSCVQSVFADHASPVQQWMSKLASPEFEKSECSRKLPQGLKENTLKAKLLEARLEGQQSRSKASKNAI